MCMNEWEICKHDTSLPAIPGTVKLAAWLWTPDCIFGTTGIKTIPTALIVLHLAIDRSSKLGWVGWGRGVEACMLALRSLHRSKEKISFRETDHRRLHFRWLRSGIDLQTNADDAGIVSQTDTDTHTHTHSVSLMHTIYFLLWGGNHPISHNPSTVPSPERTSNEKTNSLGIWHNTSYILHNTFTSSNLNDLVLHLDTLFCGIHNPTFPMPYLFVVSGCAELDIFKCRWDCKSRFYCCLKAG